MVAPAQINRIVIIKLGSFGDILQATPILPSIRKRYPKAKIEWIMFESMQPIAAHNPDISRIVTIPMRFWGILKLIWVLLINRYDLAIILHRNCIFSIIAMVCRIKIRIGMANEWHIGYHHAVKLDVSQAIMVTYQRVLRYLGIELDISTPPIFSEPVTRSNLTKAIFIAPGGGKNHFSILLAKRWHHYQALVTELTQQYPDLAIHIAGTQQDPPDIITPSPNVQFHIDRSFNELYQLMANCDVYVGNDSALLYLAMAAHLPAVGIFGPSDAKFCISSPRVIPIQSAVTCSPCWTPLNYKTSLAVNCPYDIACMQTISVQQVLDKIYPYLLSV